MMSKSNERLASANGKLASTNARLESPNEEQESQNEKQESQNGRLASANGRLESQNEMITCSKEVFTSSRERLKHRSMRQVGIYERFRRLKARPLSSKNLVVGLIPGHGELSLTREQMEEGKRRMVQIATQWFKLKEEDHAQWIGTKTDLIEIVHYVYEAQIIRTKEGEPATFRQLVWVFFDRLHAHYNANTLYRLSYMAESRKGMYMPTMLWRFCWLMFERGISNPLANKVVLLPPPEDHGKDLVITS